MARIRINTRTHTKEKPYLINLYFFFFKIGKAKKSIGWARYMYVCEWDMCCRNFCNFPWWLKNVKSRSKIAPFFFFKWAPFWNLISKKKTITFFWSKLPKLHKKDSILHVTTTFSLKQGETRTNNVPIPHPLTLPSAWRFTKVSKNGKVSSFSGSLVNLMRGCKLSMWSVNCCAQSGVLREHALKNNQK